MTDQLRGLEPKEMKFYIEAELDCGANLKLFQRAMGLPWEIIVTPKAGVPVEDVCSVKDGAVHLFLGEKSAIGTYSVFKIIIQSVFGVPERKKFLGIF